MYRARSATPRTTVAIIGRVEIARWVLPSRITGRYERSGRGLVEGVRVIRECTERDTISELAERECDQRADCCTVL